MSLSPSGPQEEPELQTQNPDPTPDDDDQDQEQKQSDPQSPHTETLESSDPQNPLQSELDQAQSQQLEEQEDPQVLDAEGEGNHHHQEPGSLPDQSGMPSLSPPPIVAPQATDPSPPSLTSPRNPPRRSKKKKKVGKKKIQAIEQMVRTLTENLKPIPFAPSKSLNFDKHEELLKVLGLWDFVHVEFDRSIRVDLIAQLIANYDPRSRASYVNELRVAVNRADLARALKLPRSLKLPVKKNKGNASDAVDLDSDELSQDSITFIEDFVSNWVLLHEDTWMMPGEVLNWTKPIKDGCPEKVDWGGLIWFMVEKELMQGKGLQDCYYASHLQYLIKSQREVLWQEPDVVATVEVEDEEEEEDGGEVKVREEPSVEAEAEVKEEEDVGEVTMEEESKPEGGVELNEEEVAGEMKMAEYEDFPGQEQKDDDMVVEPNVALTLGQDIVENDGVKGGDTMDVEESNEEEQGQWLLDGKNSFRDHFLQRCSTVADTSMYSDDNRKPEEDEEEVEGVEEEGEEVEGVEEEEETEDDGFNLITKGNTLHDDVLTGNLIHGLETSQIPFGLPGQLPGQSNMKFLVSKGETHSAAGGPSIFGNGVKREIDHENDILHDSLSGDNKRLRTDGPWSHKSSDFELCIDNMQHWMEKARMMYQEKAQASDESNVAQHFLLSEIQTRDSVIEDLHKIKREELQKKDGEIYRLERELYVMGNLIEGYRKALQETHRAFSEYREHCKIPEEPIYKDAGPGGIVLSTMELEKQKLKQEEEDRLTRLMIEQKAKEVAEESFAKLEACVKDVEKLDKRLMDSENQVKLLKELSAKPKVSETSNSASNE